MSVKSIFTNWTQIASALLLAGSLAWAIKLSVIIATNGRIIDTGAAAMLMTVGLPLLVIGSTSIGHRIAANKTTLLRILAILLSPLVLFGACFLLTTSLAPLVTNSSVPYAAQELPIAVVVLVCLPTGYGLFKSTRASIA
ncbi:hypothetical protein HRG84_14790 [Flavisolibacter sp. BT320]|nr:hypothetical protein [Flavisolibacter longurius]